jgi:hypothetical protein
MTYLLKVNVLCQLHILRMDAENLKTACRIRDTNIDLTIKSTKPTKGRVNGVWPVGGSHHDDVRSSFETVHEGEQL